MGIWPQKPQQTDKKNTHTPKKQQQPAALQIVLHPLISGYEIFHKRASFHKGKKCP